MWGETWGEATWGAISEEAPPELVGGVVVAAPARAAVVSASARETVAEVPFRRTVVEVS